MRQPEAQTDHHPHSTRSNEAESNLRPEVAERRRPHPAPVARRILMLAIILGVLAGFALLVWLAVEIRTLTDDSRIPTIEDVRRAARLFHILAWSMSASAVGVAIWIGHFAWRVRRDEVYPPPGSRHLRVRRVLRGEAARRIANACFVIAALLFVCGLVLAPLALRVLASLGFAEP